MSDLFDYEQFIDMCLEEILHAPEYIRKKAAFRIIDAAITDIALRDAYESAINNKQKHDEEHLAKVEILDDYRGEKL
jgi:hypothetical protein